MSLSLTAVQQVEFDALVKAEYQSRGFILRDTMRIRSDVTGNQVQFRKVGQVIAYPAAYQEQVTGQDPGYYAEVATLQKYMAPTYVDEVQDLTVNFDARRENAMVVAYACGRRSDQIMINALDTSGTTNTIANGGTNMTYDKMLNVLQFFEENAVPLEERFIAMSGNNMRSLLASDQIISRLYTSNDAVVTGTLNYRELLGMNVRIIPNMPEGGLPKSGNIRTCFAWQKMALGMGIGQDMRTEINYVPERTSWLVNGIFFGGATSIDNLGVITVDCDESVVPTAG